MAPLYSLTGDLSTFVFAPAVPSFRTAVCRTLGIDPEEEEQRILDLLKMVHRRAYDDRDKEALQARLAASEQISRRHIEELRRQLDDLEFHLGRSDP